MFGIPEWAFGVGFVIVAISIGKAIAGRLGPPDRLRGPRGSRRHMAHAIEELQKRVGGSEDVQSRLDALEDVQRQLADVEERLDFAERMLAKQRDAERIGPPKS
jgi:ubiquinone biosynthesis protein UbiJ